MVVSDLLAAGHAPAAVVVIDTDPERALLAARRGVFAAVGDASFPKFLRLARVAAAHSVVVCVGDDVATIRIVRQARLLAPSVRIAAAVWATGAELTARDAGAGVAIGLSGIAGRLAARTALRSGDGRPR